MANQELFFPQPIFSVEDTDPPSVPLREMIKMKKVLFVLLMEVFILLLMKHVNVFAAEHVEGTTKKPRVNTQHQDENPRAQKPTDWQSDAFQALQHAFYQTAFFKGFTDKQLDALQADIQHTIHQGEILRNAGKYAEALRFLFDAMYMEQRTQLLLGMENERRRSKRRLPRVFCDGG